MDGMKAFALINFTEIPQHCVVIIGSYPAGLAGRGEKVSERDGLGHGWHEYIYLLVCNGHETIFSHPLNNSPMWIFPYESACLFY
jgi:hypothetical protein